MIPPNGAKRKLGGVVNSVPPDKSCVVLDGELTHEKWDENESENFADSDDGHILLKWGVIINVVRDDKFQKVQYDPPYN